MANIIRGRGVSPAKVQAMTNCRLRATYDELQRLLAMVETEIEARLGKGGGGLA